MLSDPVQRRQWVLRIVSMADTLPALRTTHYALRTTHYALRTTHSVPVDRLPHALREAHPRRPAKDSRRSGDVRASSSRIVRWQWLEHQLGLRPTKIAHQARVLEYGVLLGVS